MLRDAQMRVFCCTFCSNASVLHWLEPERIVNWQESNPAGHPWSGPGSEEGMSCTVEPPNHWHLIFGKKLLIRWHCKAREFGWISSLCRLSMVPGVCKVENGCKVLTTSISICFGSVYSVHPRRN